MHLSWDNLIKDVKCKWKIWKSNIEIESWKQNLMKSCEIKNFMKTCQGDNAFEKLAMYIREIKPMKPQHARHCTSFSIKSGQEHGKRHACLNLHFIKYPSVLKICISLVYFHLEVDIKEVMNLKVKKKKRIKWRNTQCFRKQVPNSCPIYATSVHHVLSKHITHKCLCFRA